MWAIIATWRMALEGVTEASNMLANNSLAKDAIVKAICEVEDNPYYKSVGYGGLPNKNGVVELDAAFMNGDTFNIGAVGAIKDFKNPIKIAEHLSHNKVNNFLVGQGAEEYAQKHDFERVNMLSDRAKIHYSNRVKEVQQKDIKPYSGHDTVGMVALDLSGSVVSGTSTSGLFMKEPGRVGDSPVIGSGLYADSDVGGAVATGLGEDLMKGAISYEIVRLMEEGNSPQVACEKAVTRLSDKLSSKGNEVGDLSVVAINNKGDFGCATNIDNFSFVIATKDLETTVYVVNKIKNGKCTYEEASQEWLDDYIRTRTAPLELL